MIDIFDQELSEILPRRRRRRRRRRIRNNKIKLVPVPDGMVPHEFYYKRYLTKISEKRREIILQKDYLRINIPKGCFIFYPLVRSTNLSSAQ